MRSHFNELTEYSQELRNEQEKMNANRDIMRFVQILDELVGEESRD